jgi:hypothetical protein
MSKIAASIVAPVIASQLKALSGNVAVINPQSHIARFIFGELKGGEHKHDYSMGIVRTAIQQALQGNTRDIPEAVKLCTGKSVKARAYLAGFHVIADSVKPMAYQGKLADKENVLVRQQIIDHAQFLSCEFEVAYLATIENAKIEAAFNKKAKAKTAPVVAAPADAANEAVAPASAPVMSVDSVVVDIATSVDAVVQALQAGMLSAHEIEMLALALAVAPEQVALAA